MPSHLHEILIAMFRDRPALAAEMLTGPLRLTVPEFEKARLTSGDLTDVAPTEYRADAVVTLEDQRGPVLAVVIEVQRRTDQRKRLSWPVYLATLYARLNSPVVLLVVCPTQTVADWCAEPIEMGPGSVVTPKAFGPDQVPTYTDLDTARRNPEFAVLAALARSTEPDPTPAFETMLAALDVIDHDRAKLYTDLVLAVLPEAVKHLLEELMTTTGHKYHSDFARKYYDEGEARGQALGEVRGEAKALLTVLKARGVEIPDDIRAVITACTDPDALGAWLERAASANTIQDLHIPGSR